ncbi:putative nucleotidyltransferase substrate binding domain-containing protein [Microvirgula aerodenitrificans]|uniref:putative nucleotidyltransferase substrate binding domain-containing protein n=1 Tax=Microvirgula aerodenitrificans TaxID=57480 RepID=UPI00248DEB8A|nr:putative nucleotidyltransferase substrate binding domain-containing protein [Microvirgula aerodenitrificans]
MQRFDFSHPPFDVLGPAERSRVEQAVDILYFAAEAVILAPGEAVEHMFVVMKGMACERADDGEIVAVFRENDTFDSRALIAGRAGHRIDAHEETLLFAIPKAVVMALIDGNSLFAAFFFQSAAQKFAALAGRGNNRELQTILTASVRDAVVKPAVFLPADATVFDAAVAMRDHKVRSVLVGATDRVGIFTTSDCRDVIINGTPSDTPLDALCRFELITVDIDDYLFDALLIMTRHIIQRVVVTEEGRPVGVLEQIDLLSYFSNHSHLIAQQLEVADSLDALRAVAAQMETLIAMLAGHGVKARELARLMQALNGKLFARAWELIAPAGLFANSCLVVMGSEGRGEQIIKTDQDNALIVRDGYPLDGVMVACEAFSAALADFGYPPCPGRIMVNNPEWVQSQTGFRNMLYRWIYQPDEAAQMKLAIFVDASTVAGDASLLQQAREYLFGIMHDDASYFARFARAVDQFDAPMGLLSQWLGSGRHGAELLDLKKTGIFPIVHGVRAYALESGLDDTNTFDRLTALAAAGRLDGELAHDTAEALSFLLELRLAHGLEAQKLGQKVDTQIDAARLSTLERDLLKDALAVVKRFKTIVRHHFKSGAF